MISDDPVNNQRESKRLASSYLSVTFLLFAFSIEEFILLLPEIDLDGANVVAERLRREVAIHPFLQEMALQLTISIGITYIDPASDTYDTVFCRADSMLYQAKRSGRNRVFVYR